MKVLIELFWVFFKAGTFTFAGGLAMLPVIQKDVVEKYRFMPEEDFLEYATLAQTLPGIIALNCAVFVGRRTAGTLGMLVAGFGAVFSAFVLMIAATVLLQFIPQQGAVIGALQAIRAASAALILSAAFSIGRHNLKSAFAVVVMLVTFALVLFMQLGAVVIIIAAGFAGYFYQKIRNRIKSRGGQNKK
ncbi:MAG: chromate transporter [Oscillospiraceae bacterium]|nr:chromate transporter [Oscillospiraceae bacterium]